MNIYGSENATSDLEGSGRDLIYKALANATRRQIIRWLREPDRYFPDRLFPEHRGVLVTEIVTRSSLSQSTVSSHLAALRSAGLVISDRTGQWAFYSVVPGMLSRFFSSEVERLDPERNN